LLQELAQLAELLLTALNAPTQLFASHAILDTIQALLESALHAPPPSTLLHAPPPPPLPVLLVSTTLVLHQQSPAVDASTLPQVLQSPTALNAAQITRIFALLAQLVMLLLPLLPHVSPSQLPVVSPAATLVLLQLLPHALHAQWEWLQMLPRLHHAPPLE